MRHDVANKYGNWDHIVVGPPGVFVVDSKRLSGRVTVEEDGLSAGRTRFSGKTFRGASVGLREALMAYEPSCPWVQTVVAVWGDSTSGPCEEKLVIYVSAPDIVDWLRGQPTALSSERKQLLAEAVQRL